MDKETEDYLLTMLFKHEGYSRLPYNDTLGYSTIGVGRNLETVGLSKDEAIYLLKNDIGTTVRLLEANLDVFVELSNARKIVLINMAFNMGMSRLRLFKKMIKALEAKDYKKAADEMLDSRWATQVKARAIELANMMRADGC